MDKVIFAVLLRIISNSYLNVFQKILTSKGARASSVNFYTYLGLVIISSVFITPFVFTSQLCLNIAIMGLLGALGNYFIIKALSVGELSSVAPINSYKPIVALLIAFLYLGEVPSLISLIGIIFIIVGTYFIFNTKKSLLYNKNAIFFRVLALIFSGAEAVFIKKIILLTNVHLSLFLWAFSGLMFASVFVCITKEFPQIPPIKEQSFLILSVLAMQYTTNYVFANMNVSSALALFQLSTLLSVFLGINIFKEKGLIRKMAASILMIIGAAIVILF